MCIIPNPISPSLQFPIEVFLNNFPWALLVPFYFEVIVVYLLGELFFYTFVFLKLFVWDAFKLSFEVYDLITSRSLFS